MKVLATSLLCVAITASMASAMMMGKMMKMKKMKKMQMEYFMASGPEDTCGTVPAETMMGLPMMDGCAAAEEMAEVCLCIRKPQEMLDMMQEMGKDVSMVNAETGFGVWCGTCHDPCSLKWKPDMEEMDADAPMMPDPMLAPILAPLANVPTRVMSQVRELMSVMEKMSPSK